MSVPVVESTSGAMYEEDTADDIITLNKPSGTVSGNLLVALLGNDSEFGIWDSGLPSGWTLGIPTFTFAGWSTVGVNCAVAWLLAGGSEPTSYDFTKSSTSGSVMMGGILRISGAHATDPFHKTATAVAEDSIPVCPDVTTTVPDCLILRFFIMDDNDYTDNSTPTGHTVLWAESSLLGSDCSQGAAYESQVSAGSPGTASFTGSGTSNEQWCAATVAIQPPAAGAPPFLPLGRRFANTLIRM